MCGRYYRRSDKQKIAEAFHIAQTDDFVLAPWDYNLAPTTFQPAIRHNRDTGDRELTLMRWGLVPHFAKSLKDFRGFSTINARAEGIIKSATWRIPFQRRRCLVPLTASTSGRSSMLRPSSLSALACQTVIPSPSPVCGAHRRIPKEAGCKASLSSQPRRTS